MHITVYSNSHFISFTIIAPEWFDPRYIGRSPEWEDDYDIFMIELQTNFGPFDPVSNAKTDLKSLKMGENQCFVKFVLTFNCLSSLVDWNDQALHHLFY